MFGSGGKLRKALKDVLEKAEFINEKTKKHQDIPADDVYRLFEESTNIVITIRKILAIESAIQREVEKIDKIM